MAVQLKPIADFRSGDISVLKLLSAFVLGDQGVDPYDPTKTYKKYDTIIELSPNGDIRILMCQDDSVTGTYDPSKWKVVTVRDSITGEIIDNPGGGSSEGSIELSEIKPYNEKHRVWWHIRHSTVGEDPIPEPIAVYEGNQVAAQDLEPTDPNIVLWLDFEN